MVCLIIIFLQFFFPRKKTNKLIKYNDNYIADYDYKKKYDAKKLKDRLEAIKKANKIKDDREKAKEYKEIIDNDTDLINDCMEEKEELRDQLEKTNNQLKKQVGKNFGFSFYSMAGISNIDGYLDTYNVNDLHIDLILGVDYHKYFFNNRFSLDVGMYVKPYEEVGFGGKLGFTINF